MDMTQPVGTTPLDTIHDGIVGRPLDRVDGPPKVTGTATYAYEWQDVAPGFAYGYVLGAAIAKGRIASIDTSEAETAPGVVTPNMVMPTRFLAAGAAASSCLLRVRTA